MTVHREEVSAVGLPPECGCGHSYTKDEARFVFFHTDVSAQILCCSECYSGYTGVTVPGVVTVNRVVHGEVQKAQVTGMHEEYGVREGWRTLEAPDRMEFMLWAQENMTKRQIQGRAEYGDKFQGDPLNHLEEELFDALFYCWELGRQREWGDFRD